jgi:photosystem II stability/assembly factor-like uncharacterized protein
MEFRPRTRRAQIIRLAVCLAALTTATAISLREPAPGQFEVKAAPGSWKWWLAPVEENAAFRPSQTRTHLRSVFFLPGQNQPGWAVGNYGAILRTEDGGHSWQLQPSGTNEHLLSVTFATPQSGWVVGWSGTILHTENGGLSWRSQASGTNQHLLSVAFATRESGWAVGLNGTILHTEDAGRSWQLQTSGTKEFLISVTFTSPESVWAVGWEGTILHSENGGKSWRTQDSGTRESLWSVTFATPESGWVVALNGTVLRTEDGGRSWAQISATRESLLSVSFVTPQLGWAVGDHGTILRTENAGRSWQSQDTGTAEQLTSVSFATSQSGWAVGLHGTILHTANGGRSWQPQSRAAQLVSVTFANPQSGWAVGPHGTVLHTDDGGSSWQLQSTGTTEDLMCVSFATQRSGWTVGRNGIILHTNNGGRSWLRQNSGTPEDLLFVGFVTQQAAWVAGSNGTVLRTEDGGGNWQPQLNGTKTFDGGFRFWQQMLQKFGFQDRSSWMMLSASFVTPESGWVVGPTGLILHTENAGSSWQPQYSGTKEVLASVTFTTPQSGWVVGSNGTILHTADGGKSWQMQASGTKEHLTSVTFATPRVGWALGENGTILHTEDAGTTWQLQNSKTKEDLLSVSFATPLSGWVVGANGTIQHTENGGASWKSIGQYHRWPAPWYYAALVFCLAGLFWASLKRQPENFEHIEDVANSDNPVSLLKNDVLGYRPMVLRLLRFIQNPNTAAPLVLSVQAPWGMGKSSVMRMLQSELKNQRAAATVWFNAWHHQKEDQLLAYLLEAIQKQVAPSWFSAVGLGFRFNLLRVRMLAGMERFLAVLAALALVIFHSQIAGFLASKIAPWVGHRPETLSLIFVLSFAAGILLNQVRAFSADPQKLLESPTKSAWRFLRDLLLFPSLQGKTDVRQEFEKNLREVTDALRPQRLVIFLDDLDRCRPEQVVQILEAINFLSSAAGCFIVVGADYSKVEALVGMQFEQLALQEKQNAGVEKPEPATTRLAYARSYMRKIVNIRVNLPRPATESWKKFLTQPAEHRSDSAMRWQQGLVAAVLLLCVGAVVAQAVGWIPIPASAAEEASMDSSSDKLLPAESPVAVKPAATSNKPAEKGAQLPEPAKTNQGGSSDEEDRNRVGTWWSSRLTIGTASLMALVFLVIVFRRPKEPEKAMDSKEFSQALREMAPYVYQRTRTPREMRRFLNYLRLVSAPDDPADGHTASIGEAALVRLAAGGTLEAAENPDAVRLFEERCDLFGLDPKSFTPKDEKEDESGQPATVPQEDRWRGAHG